MHGKITSRPTSYRCANTNGCIRQRVGKEAIEQAVTNAIQQQILSPPALKRLEKAIVRVLKAARPKRGSSEQRKLANRIASLQVKVDKGVENLLLCDPPSVPLLQAKLNEWREELNDLEDRQQAAKSVADSPERDLVQQCLSHAHRLRETLETSEPATVRHALKAILSAVTCWWEPNGKRHRFARGTVEFSDLGFLRVAGPGVAPGGPGL